MHEWAAGAVPRSGWCGNSERTLLPADLCVVRAGGSFRGPLTEPLARSVADILSSRSLAGPSPPTSTSCSPHTQAPRSARGRRRSVSHPGCVASPAGGPTVSPLAGPRSPPLVAWCIPSEVCPPDTSLLSWVDVGDDAAQVWVAR
jgi:hypothetical protein